MATVDTSTWSSDTDLNDSVEGIPIDASASISQTWQVLRILMAALKGDTGTLDERLTDIGAPMTQAEVEAIFQE